MPYWPRPTLPRLSPQPSATSLPHAKVRLNYDGWLALPAAARRALGVDTGDQLEIEVVDGRIVLRPLKPMRQCTNKPSA